MVVGDAEFRSFIVPMRIIADFHLHSRYSRATSQQMNLEGLAMGARVKGLNLLGTGDFTHPLWLKELKLKLIPIEGAGLFEYNGVRFMLTTEVATYFNVGKEVRRVHHVIHAPSFELVYQINEALSKRGDLSVDGRPILSMQAAELVEVLMEIDKNIFIYPAHAWTPWLSIFGSKAGFNSVEECYEDQTKYIRALETGLSSDPAMNWRLSGLDKFALLSNSDSHSPYSWRLGREANVFELEQFSYWEIHQAIKNKDKNKFLFTLEVNPSYGKYHWDGHRQCGVSMHPSEAIKLGNKCPKCGKKLTIGVLHRVEELADRPEGFAPKDATPYLTILPLYEIISHALGIGELYSHKILKEHDKLVKLFGSELNVVLNAPQAELLKHTDARIAEALLKVREGKVNYVPGYDGVYGRPVFDEGPRAQFKLQRSLQEFSQ